MNRANCGGWNSIILVVFVSAIATTAARLESAERPPNIVFILADDLGADAIGCYGNKENTTPHIDRLAADGMRFETCYTVPVCSPSRALLLTGRYGFRTGWRNFTGRPGSPTHTNPTYELSVAETTFAEVLGPRGYATGLAGRWLENGNEHEQIPRSGFDEHFVWAIWGDKLPSGAQHAGAWENATIKVTARYWNPCLVHDGRLVPTTADDYGPRRINDFCLDFVRRHRDEPFLLFYPMVLIHSPFHPVPDLEDPGRKKPGNPRSLLEYADHLIGRLVDEIDTLGLGQNTVIFFAGDNGSEGAGKNTATERGARVPFIVRWSGTVAAGAVSDQLVDFSDVLPTLADIGGARLSRSIPIDGKSILPVLRGQSVEHRDWIFSYLGDRRILRSRRWLLEDNSPGDFGRLYDCGDSRDGSGYREVTDSGDPEVCVARRRFENLLSDLPATTLLNDDEGATR